MSDVIAGNKVLLCCVELCSLHHRYAADPQQVVANALFSDGAAAIIGRADTGAVSWRLVDQFSEVLPETSDLMAWQIGDHGFDMRLSPQVPTVIKRMLKPWLSASFPACIGYSECQKLGDSPWRPTRVDGVRRCSWSRLRNPRAVTGNTRRIWQHVVADRAVHSRTFASTNRYASVRGLGVWAWVEHRSGAYRLASCRIRPEDSSRLGKSGRRGHLFRRLNGR